MTETIHEKVSVITVYNREKKSVLPWRLKWQGRVYTIRKLGFHHTVHAGRVLHHIFSVTDGSMFFRLDLDTESLTWTLEEVSVALPLNHNQPTIMHVDLNSCFATIEQQANPLLRGKPIVVAAYNSPNGCVVAPSIEAKQYGIKTGMSVRDAKLLYPGVIVRTPDPAKYRAVHLMFRRIFKDYSPAVSPKSIDEAVIDFTDTMSLHRRSLTDIGRENKKRFREEIGEWMRCSIGISTNRFLAKLAASLHKPDGLDVIDHTNVLAIYQHVKLT